MPLICAFQIYDVRNASPWNASALKKFNVPIVLLLSRAVHARFLPITRVNPFVCRGRVAFDARSRIIKITIRSRRYAPRVFLAHYCTALSNQTRFAMGRNVSRTYPTNAQLSPETSYGLSSFTLHTRCRFNLYTCVCVRTPQASAVSFRSVTCVRRKTYTAAATVGARVLRN